MSEPIEIEIAAGSLQLILALQADVNALEAEVLRLRECLKQSAYAVS